MTQANIDTEPLYHPDQTVEPFVNVGRESLPVAIKHGMELWWDESTPTKRLDDRNGSSQFSRFVNGRIEGKLAEVAFSDVLERWFDVESKVDWRIYGDYETTDNGDLRCVLDDNGRSHQIGVDVDVKKTKPWNSWLAVREETFKRLSENAPVVLSKLRIEDDIQLDPWEDVGDWETVDSDSEFRKRLLDFADEVFPLKVEFVGTAYPSEFTETFEKGDRLYDPVTGEEIGPQLKRPNRGIFVENLDASAKRWNRIVAEICAEMPADSWRPLPIADDNGT